MKKLIAVLAALCLMTGTAALAETAEPAPSFADMPAVVTLDEGVELTAADFEGSWVPDMIFFGETYMSPEDAAEAGAGVRPFRIADGRIYMDTEGEDGETYTDEMEITVESNQLLGSDSDNLDFVIEKLTDGNIVLSIFVPGEDGTVLCVSVFMVPAES